MVSGGYNSSNATVAAVANVSGEVTVHGLVPGAVAVWPVLPAAASGAVTTVAARAAAGGVGMALIPDGGLLPVEVTEKVFVGVTRLTAALFTGGAWSNFTLDGHGWGPYVAPAQGATMGVERLALAGLAVPHLTLAQSLTAEGDKAHVAAYACVLRAARSQPQH